MIKQFSAAFLICVAGHLCAIADTQARSLNENSPFLPPSHQDTVKKAEKQKQPPPVHSGRFVLRGISKIGPTYLFSIYDSQTKKAKWVKAGVSANGFLVTSYSPETSTISYRWNSYESTIQLANADDMTTPLTFIKARGSAHAGQSPSERAGPKDVPLQVNHSQHPSSSHLSGQSNPIEQTRKSSQTIFFDPQSVRSNNSGFANTNLTDPSDNGFASDDSFADPQASVHIPKEIEAAPQQRYKVARRNTVNNANGKKPDHMTWAAWSALKNSQ